MTSSTSRTTTTTEGTAATRKDHRPTFAVRHAFEKLGEGPHEVKAILEAGREWRPHLGAKQVERALLRLREDGEVVLTAPGLYAWRKKTTDAERQMLRDHRWTRKQEAAGDAA